MQLILVNRIESCVEDRMLDWNCEVHVVREEVSWQDGSDQVAQKLISDLFPGEVRASELKIKLKEVGSCNSYNWKLMLKPTNRNRENNILKSLRNRFYDKVRISVGFGPDQEYVSTEEMPINYGDYKCLSLTPIHLATDAYEFHGDFFNRPMTIIAHICLSDDDILASAQVPSSKKIFDEPLFSDVIISTKEGTELKAHKCFLAACSPVLRAAFESGLEESKTGQLYMSDISEKGVRAFLRYIYYQDLEEAKEDIEIGYELLYAAHKYNVLPLEIWGIGCFLDTLDEHFTTGMAFTLFAFVRNIPSAGELKSKMANILKSKLNELDTLPQFKELLMDNPESVMELRSEIANADMEGGNTANATPNKKRKVSE